MEAPAATFTRNATMNFHVFHAATLLGVGRVVWASSETTLGLPFETSPRYVPIDEAHYPFPTTTYALSKVVTETLAEQMAAWSGIPFVALRFSNIMATTDYARFPSFQADARLRKWNLWSYIDLRDAAAACRLALTAPVTDARSYIIANADTVMERPTAELLAEVFPGVTVLGRYLGKSKPVLIRRRQTRPRLGAASFLARGRWVGYMRSDRMYQPAHDRFRVDDAVSYLAQLAALVPATLVTLSSKGLLASTLPMVFHPADGRAGVLRGHLARGNPQWRDIAGGHRRAGHLRRT